jgi:uncharacterized protein
MLRRYPLISFFALAYLISWVAWAPYVLSRDGLGLVSFEYPRVFGDSQLVGILPGGYLGPLTAAFMVTAVVEGRSGLRRWRGRLLRWRIGIRWYLFAVIGIPMVMLAATLAVPGAVGGVRLPGAGPFIAFLPVLVLQVLTTGVAEEPGWRDFALPRVQERYGPMGGSLLLGVLWAGWHLPLFLTTWSGRHTEQSILAVYLGVALSLSVVIAWVFNRTRESLPAAMLVHASNNTVMSTLWVAAFPALDPFADALRASAIGFGLLAVALTVLTRGRLGYAPDADVATPVKENAGRT